MKSFHGIPVIVNPLLPPGTIWLLNKNTPDVTIVLHNIGLAETLLTAMNEPGQKNEGS